MPDPVRLAVVLLAQQLADLIQPTADRERRAQVEAAILARLDALRCPVCGAPLRTP